MPCNARDRTTGAYCGLRKDHSGPHQGCYPLDPLVGPLEYATWR